MLEEMLMGAKLRPGVANALHLSALDREQGLWRALVSFNDLELGSQDFIEDAGHDAERRARAGAGGKHLHLKDVVHAFNFACAGGDANAVGNCRRSDPNEFQGVGFQIGLSHDRLAWNIAREGTEGSAILRCLSEQVIRGDDARRSRHVLYDDDRLSRQMAREMSRKQAPAEIIISPSRMSDDHADFLVWKRIRGLSLHRRACCQHEGHNV